MRVYEHARKQVEFTRIRRIYRHLREGLQKAGFKCGVEPTILPKKEGNIERKREWTCRFEWRGGYAEFYMHKKE